MPHTRFTRLLLAAVVATYCLAWSSTQVLAQVTFDWVTVGNAGNSADSTGYGAVAYTYEISKHEVTNEQYTEFLNAVAATDTHMLYNTLMGSDPRGGITRSGNSGSYTYSIKTNMGNKPVNYVSFFDAMRFTNWLENGQGAGDTETGVYTIGNGLNETRAIGARFFISRQDELYKAAYNKNDGVTGNYWDYPTNSDTLPAIATANANGDISNPGSNVANYSLGADWNGQDGNVTTVGSALSTSAYGTFDQGGNVWEWNESVSSSTYRGLRGGGWDGQPSYTLAASTRFVNAPTFEVNLVGFRVARVVDEPTMIAPESVTATRGSYVAGDAAHLAVSDNDDYQLRRLNSDVQSRTEFEVKSTSPTASPTSFEFTLEGAVFARSNVVQTIELFDYDAAAWELVDTTNAARSPAPDSAITVEATGDLSRFVEAGTMCIEARVHFQSDNPRQRFASNTDQAIWTIGQ